jgi:hypothetical protein
MSDQNDQPQSNVDTRKPILPENFDGVFRFSNPTEEDFIGIWGNKEYHFPAGKTVPMVMPEFSPIEIQHIRKKFAKNLAEREFYKTHKYEQLRLREGTKDEFGVIQPRAHGMSHAGTYTEDDLAPIIQKCLEPLEDGSLTTQEIPKQPVEETLSRNDDGELVTEAIDSKTSLKEKALKS